MKKLISLFLSMNFIMLLSAQDESSKKVTVGDIYIYSGVHSGSFDFQQSDFNTLAPSSQILSSDLINYKEGYSGYSVSGNYLTMKLGLDFKNKESGGYKLNPQLQIGITYMTNNSGRASLYRNTTVRADTLSSSSTSNIVYVDSMYRSNVYSSYASDNLLLDLALIYRTDTEARWSFFGGFGFAGGVSINAKTDVFMHDDVSVSYKVPGSIYDSWNYSNNSSNYNSEVFRNEMNFLIYGQLPLGVNFKVAKSTRFWKDLNLFYEITPVLKYFGVPQVGGFISTGVKHGIGLKLHV
jgi:hypothetical protein